MLEIKTKTPGNRTDKQQRPRTFGGNGLSIEEQRWAEECTGVPAPLSACAWSTYQRLTLLGQAAAGRITIDLNVALGTSGGARLLRDTVLIEVKQERINGSSSVLRLLRLGGAHPVSLSKYVAAMMTSGEHTPAARFKAVLGRYARPENWGECHA
jgi:hypothetical protein